MSYKTVQNLMNLVKTDPKKAFEKYGDDILWFSEVNRPEWAEIMKGVPPSIIMDWYGENHPFFMASMNATAVAYDWAVIKTTDVALEAMGFVPEDTESDPYLNAAVSMILPYLQMTSSSNIGYLTNFLPLVAPLSRKAQQWTGGRLSDWMFYYLGLGDEPAVEKERRRQPKNMNGNNVRRRRTQRRQRRR
jgi:hypothetical protein